MNCLLIDFHFQCRVSYVELSIELQELVAKLREDGFKTADKARIIYKKLMIEYNATPPDADYKV